MVLHGRAASSDLPTAASIVEHALHAPLPAEMFRRLDEQDDAHFYALPRKLVHIDAGAIAAVGRCIARTFVPGGVYLDLMSSWRSHLSADFAKRRMIGLGLNAEEMADNPDLDEYVVHDLNADPRLPFDAAAFDGVVVSVSIQYMTRPIEVFRDVARVLRAGCPLLVLFSNRMFPTKAVRVWHMLGDREHAGLVRSYFRHAGGYGEAVFEDCRPAPRRPRADPYAGADPLFAVWARKTASA